MLKKRLLVFIFIFIPAFLAITAGFLALSIIDRIPPQVEVGKLDAGGMGKTEFISELDKVFKQDLEEGKLELLINNNVYFVKFKNIGVHLDNDGTYKKAIGINPVNFLVNMENGYFLHNKRQIAPVIKFNKVLLIKELQKIAMNEETKPRNAGIIVEGSKLTKTGEVTGWRLDPEKAAASIADKLSIDFGNIVKVAISKDNSFNAVQPEYTLAAIKDIDGIIASFSTEIREEDKSYIQHAIAALNKTVVWPAGKNEANGEQEFSFNNRLQDSGYFLTKTNNGYNQVASTLYASLLLSGIEVNSIEKVRNNTRTNYIDPGLEVIVGEKASDLVFKNTLGSPIVILADIKGNSVNIKLAGKKDPEIQVNELKVDIDQKFEPSVVYIESSNLQSGARRLVSPGKDGLKVSVYRITSTKSKGTEQFLLDRCIYKSVDAIVQIGPNSYNPASTK